MSQYLKTMETFSQTSETWLVTGVAGFIGSNLLETLLQHNQQVIGLDNFATGHRKNLEQVKNSVTAEQWQRFNFIEGDIRDIDTCHKACQSVSYVLHQAALGSVPRSIADPITSNAANITGFLNMASLILLWFPLLRQSLKASFEAD